MAQTKFGPLGRPARRARFARMAVPSASPSRTQAVAAIAARLAAHREELCDRAVALLRAEIPDYRLADDEVIADVRGLIAGHNDLLVDALVSGRRVGDEDFGYARAGGSRRVHQGVSLEAFGRAARMWGRVCWEAVLEQTDPSDPAEREAVIVVAGVIMHHVDRLSSTVAEAYLNELQSVWSDREVLRRDLLDALVAGEGDSEHVRRVARSMRLRLADAYIVVVACGMEQFAEERADQTLPARIALRRIVETARTHLRANGNAALVGMRHGEVVALCPVAERAELEDVCTRAGMLAATLSGDDVAIGIGGFHPTLAGVARSYMEARDAADIARGIRLHGRPLRFDEVLIDQMLRSSPHADCILDSAMNALLDYDAVRQAELVPTLRAFVANGFSAARTGEALCVHPNTVAYRIRRIRELSGRDPQNPDDLLFFLLGLKLLDMRSTE